MNLSHFLTITVLVLFLGLLSFSGCKESTLGPESDLAEILPQERCPQEGDSVVVTDGVKITVTPYFWQDFMPTIPPGGPPFFLCFGIKVKNYAGKPLRGFTALIATLYYPDTQKVFHTFQLVPDAGTRTEETFLPGEEKTLSYTNDRKRVFSPHIEQGTKLYGRIMVKWNGKTCLLSSPPAGVVFTY